MTCFPPRYRYHIIICSCFPPWPKSPIISRPRRDRIGAPGGATLTGPGTPLSVPLGGDAGRKGRMRSEAASRSRGTGQRRRKDIAAPKTRDIRDVMRLWREREREEQERLSPGRGGNNVVEELLNEEELLDVLNVEYEELVTDTITSRPDKTVVHMTGISSPKSLNSLNYVDNADNSGRGGLSSSI